MKLQIIVIDNEYEERKDGYKNLERASSMLVSGIEIEIDHVKHPNELAFKLRTNRYVAAIVDAVLNDKNKDWKDYTITQALATLGNEIPIAILSARWDQTNSTEINEAWNHPNCRTFLHWRDIDPFGNGQMDYAVRALTTMIADQMVLNTQLNLAHDDPIRIVHISDVQAGGFTDKKLRLSVGKCADRILEHWNNDKPTFVAFTGDVAEHANPRQYEQARGWIEYFCKRLGIGSLPSNRIFYVPGNHDVNIPLAAASRLLLCKNKSTNELEITLENTEQMDLSRYAYTPFKEFLSGVCECPFLPGTGNDQNLAWIEGRFRHLGIVFYGVNTAQPASAYGLPDRQVDPDVLAMISDELGKMAEEDGVDTAPTVIGLGHHSPVSGSGDSAVSNHKDFETFFRKRVRTALFLHGHIHEHDFAYQSSDSLRLVRSCATTLTKPEIARPPDSLRGFNLIELSRENHVVKHLSGTSFGWIGSELKPVKSGGPWTMKQDGMFREE